MYIKLSPETIEEKIFKRIDRRFFLIGSPDADLGEKLILVIEGEQYELPTDFFDVLDKYEKPKEIIFIPKFKETGNGKIIRRDSLL